MSAGLVILLLASPLAASAQANSLGAPGCGPANVQFDVKTDSAQHPFPAPQSGKALVLFLQDDARFQSVPRPTTRFGIDGAWAGATHTNSYFYVSIDPGEHHLCASWQSRVLVVGPSRPTAAVHFTAEAGNTYCFVARDHLKSEHPPAEVVLEPLDTDEAQLLVRSFAFSSSHPKK